MSTPQPSTFHLQDSRGNVGDNLMLWGARGGYTSDISKARAFSEAEAFAQHATRPTDVPWPADYLARCTRPVVDMQYLPKKGMSAPDPVSAPDSLFYVQAPGRRYVGNDICFLAQDGSTVTTSLDRAGVFRPSEVPPGPNIALSKDVVDGLRRFAVDANVADHKEAVSDPRLRAMLVEVKPERAERYRCHGCGVFMTIGNYYGAHCARCNTDNRP